MAEVTDELMQKAEWRARLIVDIIARKFDDETLAEMLEAGLCQAHSEGLRDAADICQAVAGAVADPAKRHAARVLASSIRDLDTRNKATRPVGQTLREPR
jgi:hypothetical protein